MIISLVLLFCFFFIYFLLYKKYPTYDDELLWDWGELENKIEETLFDSPAVTNFLWAAATAAHQVE